MPEIGLFIVYSGAKYDHPEGGQSSYLHPVRNTLTFVMTIAIMYVTFPAAVYADVSAFLTTAHVTYTQQFNGNMRDKERRKVIVKN